MFGQEKWDLRFLELAKHISQWSKDSSTQVGAVFVGSDKEILSVGYNGLPRGCNDAILERTQRPEKYFWFEHAERNGIYNASRVGVSLIGSTCYSSLCPCMDCARGIIQSGCVRVVSYEAVPDHFKESDRWTESFKRTKEIFKEVGIEFALY